MTRFRRETHAQTHQDGPGWLPSAGDILIIMTAVAGIVVALWNGNIL